MLNEIKLAMSNTPFFIRTFLCTAVLKLSKEIISSAAEEQISISVCLLREVFYVTEK
jgi:hypothetical protein